MTRSPGEPILSGMRAILVILIALSSVRVTLAHSQFDYYARVGATLATSLLTDDVIQEVETRQDIAPTLYIGAAVPVARSVMTGLEASITSSGYHSTEQNVDTDLGTLRTGSILLNVAGPIWRQLLAWRAGAGLIRYWPADDEGIFLRGGTTRFLAGGGVDYRPPVLSGWDLMVSLRYDFHRFSTDELRARGFTGSQAVHRVSASLGLARGRP